MKLLRTFLSSRLFFLQSTPLRHALPLPAPLFFWFDQAENAFPFLHQNMRPLSSLRAESRTPSAGYIPPLPNRPVDCGYASILNRVARLRWIALISWAVFYRYQKTPTRISHFSLFTVKILVFFLLFCPEQTPPRRFSIMRGLLDSLTMQCQVKPLTLGFCVNTKTKQQINELEQNETRQAAVYKRCRHAGRLDANLFKNR